MANNLSSAFVRLITLFGLCLLISCNEKPKNDPSELGEIHIDYHGNEKAMPHYRQGLLLLHNFEYDDARTAFIKAQEADPEMVMAYWGEAMTHNHPLWRRQSFEDGKEALQKLAETHEERLALAKSAIEKDFLTAVNKLYTAGEKIDRDRAYNEYLADMHTRYPQNDEVATFYALSIMGAVTDGRNAEAYEKTANIVGDVLARSPRHPGALHYMIHANDDPAHAHDAIDAANAYSVVASDAIHALHMPSHIFLAVGMWEKVVSSNIDSWEASVKRKAEKSLDNDALSYHALHWLMYAYLQLGEFDKAKQIVMDMHTYTDSLPSKTARGYLVAMQGAYMIETERWNAPEVNPTVSMHELGVTPFAKQALTQGLRAYHNGDADSLGRIISRLEKQKTEAALMLNNEGLPMCSSGGNSSYKTTKSDVDNAEVMEMELRGLLALLNKDADAADMWYAKASEKESTLAFGFGPPNILKPAHELYAEFLLSSGKFKDAEALYEEGLFRAPNRRLSNIGLIRCKEGDVDREI